MVPGKDALLLVVGGVLYSEPVLAVIGGACLVVGPRLHENAASRPAVHMSHIDFIPQHLRPHSMDTVCTTPGIALLSDAVASPQREAKDWPQSSKKWSCALASSYNIMMAYRAPYISWVCVSGLLLLQGEANRGKGSLSSIDNVKMQLLISDPSHPEEEPPASALGKVLIRAAAARLPEISSHNWGLDR